MCLSTFRREIEHAGPNVGASEYGCTPYIHLYRFERARAAVSQMGRCARHRARYGTLGIGTVGVGWAARAKDVRSRPAWYAGAGIHAMYIPRRGCGGCGRGTRTDRTT